MRAIYRAAVVAACFCILPAEAAEQPGTPASLKECFMLKSTGADRLTFARWIFAAIGSAPQVQDVARIDATKKDELDRQVAAIWTRLMTVDCLDEARALGSKGLTAGMEAAGEALGTVAMTELYSNKEADAAMKKFAEYLDEKDFEVLRR